MSHAQSSDSDTAWSVKSYIWNQSVNTWARTNCTLDIGGLNITVRGAASQSRCSNIGSGASSFLQYYHDTDPDYDLNDVASKRCSDTDYNCGKIKGRAWSPLYGVIYFDPSDFPSSTCYGLTGDDRQVRIERPKGGDVRITGCAYVPLLRDYILFNRVNATHSDLPSSGWNGVNVLTVEDAANAYLVLRGCAWSSLSGFWSFGSNPSSAVSNKENCLPSGHETALKATLPESRVGTPGGVLVTVRPTRSSLKIGQEAQYEYSCPSGYNTPVLRIGGRLVQAALTLFRGSHSEIFTDPVSDLLLTCTDGTRVFTSDRSSSGAITSSVQNSFFISSFTVTPSVLAEGGFVSFGGSVSNQGSFASRISDDTDTGHCDNTVKYGCIYGVANETAVDDDESYYKWRCDGVSAAPHSGTCQIPKESSLTSETIVANDKASFDLFGRSVAIDGDTALIGADGRDADRGAVYVFTRTDTGWSQEAKLVADDRKSSDRFGGAVALDGDTALIGADGQDARGADSGAAYIFTRSVTESGTEWTQQAKLVGDEVSLSDHFGRAVALDGDTALIGVEGDDTGGTSAGAAYVFTRTETGWRQQGSKIQAEDKKRLDHFGRSVAIDGDTALIGADGQDSGDGQDNLDTVINAGAVYVFVRSGTSWSLQRKIVADDRDQLDRFGISVALDGDTALIGADGYDTGGSNAGAAYVFTRSGTNWSRQATIQAADKKAADSFGRSVALDGDTALIGIGANVAGSAGVAYVFTRTDAGWREKEKIQAGDEDREVGNHYRPLDVSGSVVLIGADSDGSSEQGAAYFYTDTAGLCDNTVRNGCAVGTANAAAVADIPAYYRWQCTGVNGGKNSGACQFSKAATPGNEGYCTVTNKVTKQEVERFNVDGINVAISGSDLAVRDAVYDFQCRYKKFKTDGSFEKWQSVSAPPVAVKVLPRNVSEQDVSDVVDLPVFSVSTNAVSVTIPSGAAMVYVYRLGDSSARQITADSLYKVFIDRDAVELSNTETTDELKERLFERAVRSRVVPVSSRSGDITKSAIIGKSLVAVARTASGVWSPQVVYTLSGDGVCDETTLNRCISGIYRGVDPSDTDYQWYCDGVGTGEDSDLCSIDKSSVKVGVCDETVRNGCSNGDLYEPTVSDTDYEWRCKGAAGGGNSRICSIAISSVKVGDCNEAVRNGCFDGDPFDTAVSNPYYTWKCSGTAGGNPSRICRKRIPIAGGWTDWTPLPAAQACGSSFTQTRACTNPAPAYGGANCSGSPSRDGIVGIQCPSGQTCYEGNCVERIDCPAKTDYIPSFWNVGAVYCIASQTVVSLPDAQTGKSVTIPSRTAPNVPNYGSGSVTFNCEDSGWVASRTCSR